MSILQALLLSLTRRDRYRLASGLPTAIAVPIASDRYRLAPRVRDRYRLASRLPIAIRQPRASRPLSLSLRSSLLVMCGESWRVSVSVR